MKSKGGDSQAREAACPEREMKSHERLPRRQKKFSRSSVLGGGKKGGAG